MTGRFALVPDSAGAPSVQGTFAYARRRLDAAASLRRGDREVVGLTAHLPLDLALAEVPRRQLQDTLAIRARADGADLEALEALTTQVRDVRGRLTADVGIRGTWDAPRLDGTLRIDSAGVGIPALNVRWDGDRGTVATRRRHDLRGFAGSAQRAGARRSHGLRAARAADPPRCWRSTSTPAISRRSRSAAI